MRTLRFTLLALLATGCGTRLAADGPDPSWEKLKSLVGVWEGTHDGKPGTRVSYRLVSNGTALMETLDGDDASQMITVYHPDGSGLFMTHYCSMGNQPRMRSQGLEGGKLEFAYVDATNLESAGGHVMSRLVMSFPTADRLVEEWTAREGGQEHVGRFEFERRK